MSSESLQTGRGSRPGPRFLQEPLCASLMQEETIASVLGVPSSHSVGSLPLGQMLEQYVQGGVTVLLELNTAFRLY